MITRWGFNFVRKVVEDFYRFCTDLVKQGMGIYCGECKCYSETLHDVFLACFEDQLDILITYKGEGYGTFAVLSAYSIQEGRTWTMKIDTVINRIVKC